MSKLFGLEKSSERLNVRALLPVVFLKSKAILQCQSELLSCKETTFTCHLQRALEGLEKLDSADRRSSVAYEAYMLHQKNLVIGLVDLLGS